MILRCLHRPKREVIAEPDQFVRLKVGGCGEIV
jgi:hypothetical protein